MALSYKEMKIINIAIMALALGSTGCGTMLTLTCNPEEVGPEYKHCMLPHIYSGTFYDITCQWGPPLDEGPADTVKAILFYDIPFSLVADTVVLPYTVVKQVKHGNIWSKAKKDNNQMQNIGTNAPNSDLYR